MRILPLLLCPLVASVVATAEEIVDKVFESRCAICHGPRGAGAMAKPLNDGEWAYGSSDEDIAAIIRDGRPEVGMPDWGAALTPGMIHSLVVYIRELERDGAAKKPSGSGSIPAGVVRTRLHDFRVTTLATLPGTPWSLAFLPDGRMLVTTREGALLTLDPSGSRVLAAASGLPKVLPLGQGGLMDVALHPKFKDNGLIYITFSEPDASGKKAMTTLARGRLRENRWTDGETLWRADAKRFTASGVHFGSRIAFDAAGRVFFTVGERGRNFDEGAQSPGSPVGKIIRLNDDGSTPPDNPAIPGAVRGLWTYGHRNPQGLAFEPATGDLYSTEHGPRGGDELNLIRPGLNYGWPLVTHGMNYNGAPWTTGETSRPGLEPPVAYWTPSLAVCGLAFCTGDAFPAWRGDLITGSLAGMEVRRLRLRDRRVTEQETLVRDIGRVRDVRCGPDGRLYALLNNPGRLIRLDPEPTPVVGRDAAPKSAGK